MSEPFLTDEELNAVWRKARRDSFCVVTEEVARERERKAAFALLGALTEWRMDCDKNPVHACNPSEWVAKVYPSLTPPAKVPRVVPLGDHDYRCVDGRIQWQLRSTKHYPASAWYDLDGPEPIGGQASAAELRPTIRWPTAERITLWADLLAHPYETP
jgi:hypothetical protein